MQQEHLAKIEAEYLDAEEPPVLKGLIDLFVVVALASNATSHTDFDTAIAKFEQSTSTLTRSRGFLLEQLYRFRRSGHLPGPRWGGFFVYAFLDTQIPLDYSNIAWTDAALLKQLNAHF